MVNYLLYWDKKFFYFIFFVGTKSYLIYANINNITYVHIKLFNHNKFLIIICKAMSQISQKKSS